LFRAEQGRVMQLQSGLPRKLKDLLKGYPGATLNDQPNPIVSALLLLNINQLAQLLPGRKQRSSSEDILKCAQASFSVLRQLQSLLFEIPDQKSFETELAHFASWVRAARRLLRAQGEEFVVSIDEERSICLWSDSDGNEVLIADFFDSPGPKRVLRCVLDSPIALCAQEWWHREGRIMPYRIPTRRELREYLCCDEPTVTKLCRAQGCTWLPRAPSGRKKGS
jgi:hypothetical protein